MPALLRFVLASAQLALLAGRNGVLAGSPKNCPVASNTPLSCPSSGAQSDLCCYNSPGGLLVQTQFWDASPSTGPSNSWTIHGLWPDKCDGTYDANCDASRAYTGIGGIIQAAGRQDLLDYMNTYWKDVKGADESFWEHEWSKHGTCISTFSPSCYAGYQAKEEVVDYFNKTVELFQSLDSYQFLSAAGIVPSSDKTYTSSDILAALTAPRGVEPAIQCKNGALDEIWYFFNTQGSAQTGTYVPVPPDGSKSSCAATGIKYLPKSGAAAGPPSPSPTATATQQPPPPGPTGGAPADGKGHLNVAGADGSSGCLISSGQWLLRATCATFTRTASGTLTSSKGPCAVVGGQLSCAPGNAAAAFGFDAAGALTFGDAGSWSAATPSASKSVAVHSGVAAGAGVAVTIGWGAL